MNPVVLVTGGCGFIGTWVVNELLARNARVIVVDAHPAPERWQSVLGKRAPEVTLIQASLLDRKRLQEAISEHGVTHIIHLAALLTPGCQQDPYLGCEVNVLGSTAIFEAARQSGSIRSVAYASSYAVYGPGTESDGTQTGVPPSFYGVFKQAVDNIAEMYWLQFGIASVAIRPHVVYGPERDQGLTAGPSLAARAAALGESYTIGYTGSVSYDYVEDVATAFVRAALECPPGATALDLPGERASVEEFVEAIAAVVPGARDKIRIAGPLVPTNVPSQPNYITNIFRDWQRTSLQDGVRRTIKFYQR
jgi:UDP-glucose 4-epimerase